MGGNETQMQLPPFHSPHYHSHDDDDEDDDNFSHLVLLIHVNSMIDKESEKRRKQQYDIFHHFNIHHNNHDNHDNNHDNDLMTGAWPCLAAQ